MRKILSLFTVVCLLLSCSTTVFAGYSTTVTYSGEGSSEWELNVPANMEPGETNEVSLVGTWDSATVFNVTSDSSVTMGNDIDDDTEILAITFNAIEQAGNNYSDISITEPISVADMPEVLFGNWRGVFNYYLTVDKAEVVDELEQDADGNYLVSTAEDLFTLAELVNSGEKHFRGKTVLLTDDIDLQNKPFTSIGKTRSYISGGDGVDGDVIFYGTFDGQGHTIYNLNVTATDQETNANSSAALFSGIKGGTVIKNLKIDGATINSTHFAGVIVGTSADIGSIIDCEVRNANVTSTYYSDDNSGDKAGVIVGAATPTTTVSGCTAIDCTVVASRDAGQLVGAGYESQLTNCTATNVEVKWNGVGAGTNIRNELVGRILG